jgi:hypothetical protein
MGEVQTEKSGMKQLVKLPKIRSCDARANYDMKKPE